MPTPTPPPTTGPRHSSWVFKLRRQLLVVVFGPVLVLAALSEPYFLEGTVADIVIDAVGTILLLAGLLIRSWATLYIGGRKTDQLVMEGPYSLSRNPLYLGSLLISLALPFYLQSLTLLAAVVLLGTFVYRAVIAEEERILEANHGEAYRRYLATVPRLFPRRDGRVVSAEYVEVSVLGIVRHFRRLILVLAIGPLMEVLAAAHAAGSIPTLLWVP